MIRIPIQIQDVKNSPWIQFGIPVPIGKLRLLDQLFIEVNKQRVDATASITSYWDDGSIKSCVVNLYSYEARSGVIEVVISPSITSTPNTIQDDFDLNLNAKKIELNTEHCQFSYDMELSSFSVMFANENTKQNGSVELIDINNIKLSPNSVKHEVIKKQHLNSGNNSDIEIGIEGHFQDQQGHNKCWFKITFAIYNKGRIVNIDYCLHNPSAAQHSMGLWDLGDPASFNFKSLTLQWVYAAPVSISYTNWLQNNSNLLADNELTIVQHASGGKNWQSPVHVDKSNQVPFSKNGFEVIQQDNLIETGPRTTPVLNVGNNLQLTQSQFWQNFPSAISITECKLEFSFFPETQGQLHELQGGEKKSQNIWLSSIEGDDFNWVHSPISVKLPDTWLLNTSFSQLMSFSSIPAAWQELINNGLESEQNFFTKRENLDEYGWRNFGDLYADHETAEHTGNDIFVSHYNNQYDPLLGFLKQYLLSGDARWFELADDLAKHVVDIDIYHTTEDKDEYNGGLFWHTDHYLQAYTSSHRSYSKHQPSDAYQDHAGGGGPGGQHCYTTGLCLHYMLTGNSASKQAVLTLSNWITNVYEGSGTCLELLLAFKNRRLAGYKNHFTGQYPLDRGTANYVVALLDSYELTLQQEYLDRVEHIFKHSFHPNEDINKRNLDDVENTWFYTVLLQAVCKYLLIKESIQQIDEHFYYCRDSLLNFARWMAVYENPYLEKPEILEYPNDTWTAQDLRKVQIFAAAHHYSPKPNQVFLQKAKYFEEDVLNRLNSSSTKTYTRIMVLVLQNYGFLNLYLNREKNLPHKAQDFNWPSALYEKKSMLGGFLTQILKRLGKLSVKNEMAWLKKRLN